MGQNRRADAVIFGFDFQVNAAIVLFLENIKDVKSLRLEGDYEDIELELNTGEYILAQAKAVEKASDDFRNVRANMKKALESLSEASQKTKTKELIVVTNSPNPFNDKDSRDAFYGHSHRTYDSLPKSAKRIVDGYLNKTISPLERKKLKIQVIPFETDDDKERYKVIMQSINDFIEEIDPNMAGLGKKIFNVWHCEIFKSGEIHNTKIKLQKKDIIWPLLVLITENKSFDETFLGQFDSGLYSEVVNRFSDTIENHCERCEFFIKILSEYNSFKSDIKSMKDKLNEFIEKNWRIFSEEFEEESLDAEVKEAITKIVMHHVISRKYAIKKVKEVTNI